MKVNLIAFVVLFSLFRAGQNPDTKSKEVGAEVKAIRFDNVTSTATVDVVNTSAKEITAYGIAYTIKYEKGQAEQGERMVEYLQGIITAQSQRGTSWAGEGEFHPGENRREAFILGAKQGRAAIGLDARVDVVIYSDRTADVQNEDVFRLFVADRNATGEAVARASEILRGAISDSTNAHPLEVADAAIQRLLDQSGTPPLRKGS